MCELTVILKDDSRTYRQKFVVYECFFINSQELAVHPELEKCIDEAKKNFEGEPEEIQIKIHLQVQ